MLKSNDREEIANFVIPDLECGCKRLVDNFATTRTETVENAREATAAAIHKPLK
jgi:hypothetical protein